MDLQKIVDQSVDILTSVGWQVLAAFLLFLIGRRLVDFGVGMMRSGLDARRVEETLVRYLVSRWAISSRPAAWWNFSANPYRRVDLLARLSHTTGFAVPAPHIVTRGA